VHWQLFASTFALIFISELPDKTAFATVLLASRTQPLAVFCGAAGAFVVQSLVAVTFGRLLSALPERFVHIGAGIVFLVLAVVMWRRKEASNHGGAGTARDGFMKGIASAFTVIFIAEWGDLTQLATATLAAKYGAPVTIFVSATLALWAVTGLGVVIGHFAKRAIQPHFLQRLASVTFAVVGIVLLVRTK
jgi:putative Ca2+/H+ antiporter (TMEM165/GDT1 family)